MAMKDGLQWRPENVQHDKKYGKTDNKQNKTSLWARRGAQ